jgi:2-polyprenyl-6-methoxyphenol hydroxylase-like FAD-dependent oxidoreductase
VKSLIIERYRERLAAPKAHAINPRSLEILRQYGLGEKRIRQLGTSRDDSSWVNFITNLSGDSIGRLPYERMDPAVLDDTPEVSAATGDRRLFAVRANAQIDDPQYSSTSPGARVDELYRQRSQCHPGEGFQHSCCRAGQSNYLDFWYTCHFMNMTINESLSQTKHEVLATIEDRSTGQLHQTKSRHLIACDGRRSKVRELLGIESESEDSDQTMMTIHFNANLRPVVGDRVGMLYWSMDPIAAGFIIGYDLDGTQVHISQVDVKQHPVDLWTEDMCRAKIRGAIGKDDVPFDILSFRPWVFRRQVAVTFQEGNIFL